MVVIAGEAPYLTKRLPYLELEFPITINQFEISPVGGDEESSARANCERDEHIKVKIAQFLGIVSPI
jgi:hypothetical protein